jgi:hypothetical protein
MNYLQGRRRIYGITQIQLNARHTKSENVDMNVLFCFENFEGLRTIQTRFTGL